MITPTAAELVRVWELGHEKPEWYRAILLLAAAFPERPLRELGAFPIGLRNVRLFQLRERLFGSNLDALVNCPSCRVALEFQATTRDICPAVADTETLDPRASVSVPLPERSISCRAPNSLDLAWVSEHGGGADAQMLLAQRAVLDADVVITPDDVEAIAAALADVDPNAEIRIGMSCVACGREWTPPFDVVGFLWNEVSTLAARILEDVRRLASAYGWSEAAIMNMSGVRRRFYLERAP